MAEHTLFYDVEVDKRVGPDGTGRVRSFEEWSVRREDSARCFGCCRGVTWQLPSWKARMLSVHSCGVIFSPGLFRPYRHPAPAPCVPCSAGFPPRTATIK